MRHPKQQRMAASEHRMKKDMVELSLQRFTCPHATVKLVEQSTKDQDDDNNSHHRGGQVVLSFSGGYYAGGTFVISVSLPETYPFRPPRVHCLTRAWHPNVELETGRISHPLLEGDWKPVQSINAVVLGIQLLFLEPNPEYPANAVAASTFIENRERFAAQVRRTLRGGHFFGFEFPPHLVRRHKRTRDSFPTHHDEDANSMDLQDDVESLTLDENAPDHRWNKRPCRKESDPQLYPPPWNSNNASLVEDPSSASPYFHRHCSSNSPPVFHLLESPHC